MIKNIAVILIKKAEKEFELHVKDASSWAEIFDVAMEIRQMALNGINEMIAKEQPEKEVQEVSPEVLDKPKT